MKDTEYWQRDGLVARLRMEASVNQGNAKLCGDAADEIERLRMTPEERETVTGLAAYCETRATINFQRWSSTLWLFLARSDSAMTVMQR